MLFLLTGAASADLLPYNVTYLRRADQPGDAYPVRMNNHRQVAFVRYEGTGLTDRSSFIGIYSPNPLNDYQAGYQEFQVPVDGWRSIGSIEDFNDRGEVLVPTASAGNEHRYVLDGGVFRALGVRWRREVCVLDNDGVCLRDEDGDPITEIKDFDYYYISGDDFFSVWKLTPTGSVYGFAEYEESPQGGHRAQRMVRWDPGSAIPVIISDDPFWDTVNGRRGMNNLGVGVFKVGSYPNDFLVLKGPGAESSFDYPGEHLESRDWRINDLGEVAAKHRAEGLWINLPAPRDGLSAGLHLITPPGESVSSPFQLNQKGDIYANGGDGPFGMMVWKDAVWQDITIVDSSVKVGYGATSLLGANDNGDLLVILTRTDGSRWSAILTPALLDVRFELSDDVIGVGDTVDLLVHVTNASQQQISSIGLIPNTIFLTGVINLNWIAAPPAFLDLAPGESGTLRYVFQSTKVGLVRIWGTASGTGAVDGSISAPSLFSPQLEVTDTPVLVEIELDDPPYGVDLPTTATVTLRLIDDDEPLTVSFPEGIPLASSESEFAELLFEPAGPVELSAASPTRSFEVEVIPRKFGHTQLSSTVEFMVDGATQNETAVEDFAVPSLALELKALPLVDGEPIVNINITEEGEITDEEGNVIEPKVEITFRNLSSQALDVTLQGLDPRARDESSTVGRITTLGEFPITIGQVPGESEVTREISLQLLQDGRFEFVATATAVPVGTMTQYNTASTGAPIAVGERYPVKLELEVVRTPVITSQNNGAALIQPGGTLKVIASVENLTTNSTLEFYGIKAEKRLNAFGAALTSDEGNQTEPAFVHDHSVEANASVILSGLIRTNKDGAPSGLVTWQGLEDIKLIDDATGEETELTMDDVLVKTTGAQVTGWLGDPLSLRVIQDYSRPFAPPSLTLVQQTAVYGYGSMIGMAEWTYDTFDAIGGIGRLAGRISGDPDYLANAMGEFSRAVWEAAQLVATTWEEMSPQQKDEFIRAVAYEVRRRGLLLVATRSPFDANDYHAAYDFTREATYSLFDGVVQAYASDDPAQIAELWGRVHGHVAMEVITAAITEIKFTKYVEGAEAAKLAESASLGPALNNQEAALRAIKSGPLDESTTLEVFGPGPEDIEKFKKVFEAFGVKGYARERAPLAYSLINEREVAIWKMEAMKPKGISDIDELLLGSNLPTLPGADGHPVNLRAITAIFWPEPDDAIRLRLRNAGHSEEIVRAAVARAASRRKEYNKYFPEFRKWKREGIPMKRNYADNGVPDPAGQGNPTRTFDYDAIYRGNDGPAIYIPKVANTNGNLRYVSGDIDWVHFSFLDGTPLDPDTAIKLYDVLMDCCGMQHPETITWINKGRTIFESKIDQIAEYLRGEKALLELSGDGPRAVRMSQKLTRFAANENARNHLIFFDNGIKSRLRATVADVETAFANLRSRTPARVFPPFLWATKELDPETETKLDGKEWLYRTDNGDELLLRNNANGEIERFDGSVWVPWTGGSSGRGTRDNADPLALTPTTGLAADAAAGSTELLIFDLPVMWPEQTTGRVVAWFAPGQTIVIAPGELTQETHTLLSAEPFILGSPLAFDHPEDTIVAVVPAGMTLSAPTSTLLSVVEDGTFVNMVWSSLPGRWYQLEVEVGGIWLPAGLPARADGYAHGTPVPATDYDPAASYRLVEVDPLPAGGLRILEIWRGSEDSSISVTWASTPGFDYQIEFSGDDLAGFSPVGPLITAEGETTTVVVSLPQGTAQAFCRVRQVTE